MEIMTRDEARAKGLKHFFTGKPCIHGHLLPRYVVSGSCTKCSSPTWRTVYRQTGGGILTVHIPINPGMSHAEREALTRYLLDACVPAFLTRGRASGFN